MDVIVLSKDELKALLGDTLRAALADLPKPEVKEELPEYLSRKQVAEYLGCSIATVDNYSRSGLLRKIYISGLPRFRRDEVREALAELAG